MRSGTMSTKTMSGYTLIEVLVYVAILSIIVGSITGLILSIYRYQTTIQDRIKTNEDLRILVKSIRDDMYLGTGVNVNAQGELIIEDDNSSNQFRYFRTNNQVFRQQNSNTPVAVTSNLTDVRVFTIEDVSSSSAGGAIKVTLDMANYPRGTLKPEIVESISFRMGLKFI